MITEDPKIYARKLPSVSIPKVLVSAGGADMGLPLHQAMSLLALLEQITRKLGGLADPEELLPGTATGLFVDIQVVLDIAGNRLALGRQEAAVLRTLLRGALCQDSDYADHGSGSQLAAAIDLTAHGKAPRNLNEMFWRLKAAHAEREKFPFHTHTEPAPDNEQTGI